MHTLLGACKQNAACLMSSQCKENLLQIQSMIQQEIKPFKNGWTNGPSVMEENAQNGKSESLTWFKYDFFLFLAVRHQGLTWFPLSEAQQGGQGFVTKHCKDIIFLLIRKKLSAIPGSTKISENIETCESQFNIMSPFSMTLRRKGVVLFL